MITSVVRVVKLLFEEALLGVEHLLFGGQAHANLLVTLDCIDFVDALQSEDLVGFGIFLPIVVAGSELGFDYFVQNPGAVHSVQLYKQTIIRF